jgi:hypothetical protein
MKKGIIIGTIVIVVIAIIAIAVYLVLSNKKRKEQEALMQQAILESQLADPSTSPAVRQNIFTQLSVLAQQLKDLKNLKKI